MQVKVGVDVKMGYNQCEVGKAAENDESSCLGNGPCENEEEGRQPVENAEGSYLLVP